VKAAGFTLSLLAMAAAQSAAAASWPKPWAVVKFAGDVTGSGMASILVETHHPVLMAIGGTYMLADLAADTGDAALDRRDRYLGAELVIIGKDAARLKEIKAAGGDLKGKEATEIRQRLVDQKYDIERPGRSPYGYTAAAIVENLPYAVSKVAMDKLLQWAAGKAIGSLARMASGPLERLIGKSRLPRLREPVNWALNNGGPLETYEREIGWGQLSRRAREAQKLADEAMQEESIKVGLRATRTSDLAEIAADGLTDIYEKVMHEHPSAPRYVQLSEFRMAAAAQPVMLPAAAAAAVAAPVMAARVDPVIQAIRSDDFRGYTNSGRSRSDDRPSSSPTATAAPQSSTGPEDNGIRTHLVSPGESATVGDGHTFCHINCGGSGPSITGGPDGARGQSWLGR